MTLLRRRGQSTGEYAVLFAIVLGSVVAMQNYVGDKIKGSIKKQADTAFNSNMVTTTNLPARNADSLSRSSASMNTAFNGTMRQDSDSRQVVQ